jgi:hypothetical protein
MQARLVSTGPSPTTLHEAYARCHRIDTAAPVTSASTILAHQRREVGRRLLLRLPAASPSGETADSAPGERRMS